jgi:hypothetical protein
MLSSAAAGARAQTPEPKPAEAKPEEHGSGSRFSLVAGPGVHSLYGITVIRAHVGLGLRLTRLAMGPYVAAGLALEPGWTLNGMAVHRANASMGLEMPIADTGLWAAGDLHLGYELFVRTTSHAIVGWPQLGLDGRLGFDFVHWDSAALLAFLRGDVDWSVARTMSAAGVLGVGARF